MTELRVGLVGLGSVCAGVHYPGLARVSGVRVAAVCDIDGERLRQRQQEWGVEQGYARIEDMLPAAQLDAVVIATPNDAHPGLVRQALAAGCHVLCEKPLALDAGSAERMYRTGVASGRRHMTALTYRFVPAMRYLHHLVQQGDLGELRHARFQRLQDWGEGPIGWRQYRSRAGIGELGDMGIHRIDLAESLLGPISHVTAAMRQVVPRDRTTAGAACAPQDVEDWVAWIAEFEGGATGVFEMGKLTRGRGPSGDHDVAEI
ncbi:MAG: Gfo/Idh/MocA family oxidoreductase, partial [Gemmatimonadota bacterium]